MTGRDIRFERLFGPSGKAAVVACDHGMFDGLHRGMERIPALLEKIGDQPDGILLSPGMLRHARSFFGRRGAPVPIVRLNFNSVFCFKFDPSDSVISNLYQPDDAVALGAEWVLICLTLRSSDARIDARNAEIFADLCVKAHRLGVPVIGEYFPRRHAAKPADAFHDEVLVGCRMLAELGADCIKTFHTCRFNEVTSACPIPILGLGSEKLPTDYDALALAEREMRDGAAGVVFGRNAVQASDPAAFVAALQDVVKRGMSARHAVSRHGLSGPSKKAARQDRPAG